MMVCKTIGKGNRRCARYFGSETGLAATEFALLLPVMFVLFFGIVESCAAFEAARRAEQAVDTLADLVSQESEISTDDIDDLLIGVKNIISTGDVDLTFRVISLIVDPDSGDVVVDWSRDSAGAEPYASGASYTKIDKANFYDNESSIIVTEITYNYEPTLTQHFIGDISIAEQSFRWPRRAARVSLKS